MCEILDFSVIFRRSHIKCQVQNERVKDQESHNLCERIQNNFRIPIRVVWFTINDVVRWKRIFCRVWLFCTVLFFLNVSTVNYWRAQVLLMETPDSLWVIVSVKLSPSTLTVTVHQPEVALINKKIKLVIW